MITFEVVDAMPIVERKSGQRKAKRVVVHGAGPYISGHIRLPDGRQSPEYTDPMDPFRWLARRKNAL